MKKILIVEDNKIIIKGLKFLLEQENFDAHFSINIKEAIDYISNNEIDLCLLDITLPDGTGFELCEHIKKYTDIPIIFLTARDEEENIVKGIDMGAEDYIVKPFRNKELISRIKNVLRRTNISNSKILYENIIIDLDNHNISVDNKNIEFTTLEYKILTLLINNAGTILTRQQILDRIWDISGNFVNDNTLTVYIKRIRNKLNNANFIKTIKGIGYKVDLGDIVEK